MNTRTASSSSSSKGSNPQGAEGQPSFTMPMPWADRLDASRQQMALGAEMTAHGLAACQALGLVNQHMLERLAMAHRQAAESLRAATTPEEAWAAQASLLATALQDALRYWQEVLVASSRVAVPASADRGTGSSAAATTPGEMAAAAVQAAAPVMKAWQSMFTGPVNGGSAAPH